MKPAHKAIVDRRWDRKLWGVAFSNGIRRVAPMLIGESWDSFQKRESRPGEPTRALLFTTRAVARAWCRARNRNWKNRNDIVRKWHVMPVRVRESCK